VSRHWPRSVRARLALWHGVALLVVVSIYAAAVLVQVRTDLYEALDSQLQGDVALATRWLRELPAARPAGNLTLLAEPTPDLPWVEVWSRDGHRLFATSRRPGLPPPDNAPGAAGRAPVSVRLADNAPVRTLSAPALVGSETVLVRVGRSEADARLELTEFATALLVSLPFAFAVAAGAGYLLARRALAPIEEMTSRARRITAERLEDRLPVDDPEDEFGQLATVINAALARLERSFETLRRFTADASHELRTPLTAIRSVGEVGLREHRTEGDYREIVGSILEETDLQPTSFSLGELASEVTEDLSVLAEERRQSLEVQDAGQVRVRADRPTLRQAVINLVDNAIKYSPEETAIRLITRRDRGQAVLEVIDAGPGIGPEHLPHVFERFYRADKARSRQVAGTGLGLSIARWAVEANGGRVEAESTEGRGSTFRIVLPAA